MMPPPYAAPPYKGRPREMTRAVFILLACLFAPALFALDDDLPRFEIKRGGGEESARHRSETSRFRETGVKEFGFTYAVFYTLRSYNVTDIHGLDNQWSSVWVKSFDFWGLGFQTSMEYRFAPDWRINLTPRADVAYGILNEPRHVEHSLQKLPFNRNYRGAYDIQKISVDLRFEFAVRWRYLWFVQDFQAFLAFRRVAIRAYDTDYEDDQLGKLDLIKDRERVDWEHIYMFGAGTGIGFEWFFIDESYRFVTLALWRPYASLSFRDRSGLTNGIELVIRSSNFEITDQLGIYFEISGQAFLPVDHRFNTIYFTKFSVGVRFR